MVISDDEEDEYSIEESSTRNKVKDVVEKVEANFAQDIDSEILKMKGQEVVVESR